jgi:glycosyltransferase involved in cell wall biosynthesis
MAPSNHGGILAQHLITLTPKKLADMTTSTILPPLHIVMTGIDTAYFTGVRSNDIIQRYQGYLAALQAIRPGSKLTYLSLGALALNPQAKPFVEGALQLIPCPKMWHLPRLLATLHHTQPIDLVTTQTCTEEAWLAALFAKPRHIPLVMQEHSDPFEPTNYRGPLIKRTLKKLRHHLAMCLLFLASAVRPVSPVVMDRLLPYIPKGVMIDHIAVPIPLPKPATLAALRTQEPSPRHNILYVGRFAPEKNMDTALQTFARLIKDMPDLHFDLVGDGPLRPHIEKLIDDLKISSHITLHGWLKPEQMPAMYSKAAFLFSPSFSEGLPRVLIEAITLGIPVVAGRNAGSTAIFRNTTAAFVHEPLDIDAFEGSIRKLLASPELQDQMIAEGLRLAENYQPAHLASRWMGFLVNVYECKHKSKSSCAC